MISVQRNYCVTLQHGLFTLNNKMMVNSFSLRIDWHTHSCIIFIIFRVFKSISHKFSIVCCEKSMRIFWWYPGEHKFALYNRFNGWVNGTNIQSLIFNESISYLDHKGRKEKNSTVCDISRSKLPIFINFCFPKSYSQYLSFDIFIFVFGTYFWI